VKILRFLVAEDAGRLINPAIADGRSAAVGVAQGIANALYEELAYDEDGNLSTASLMDYLPPTIGRRSRLSRSCTGRPSRTWS